MRSTFGAGAIDPALVYYSTNDDVSIRVESRDRRHRRETYFELRNQNQNRAWKLGMNNDHNLHIGYGSVGTADGTPDAIRIEPSGSVKFFGNVKVKGGMYRHFAEMTCTNGPAAVSTTRRRRGGWVGHAKWTPYASCPEGTAAVGVGSINQIDASNHNYVYPLIDAIQCNHLGCKAFCRSTRCQIQARCCRTDSGPLECAGAKGGSQMQYANRWGHLSSCAQNGREFKALGYAELSMYNWDYHWRRYVNDFQIGDTYARAWIFAHGRRRNPGGLVQARCCKPRVSGRQLKCTSGSRARSQNVWRYGNWGPYSTCPEGHAAVGIARLDLTRQHHWYWHQNIRRYECTDSGCRAWCDGSACNVWAKCCQIAVDDRH